DDGSKQYPCEDVVRLYKGNLKIKIFKLEENKGIEYALNYGLEKVINDYEYIARLDCGDLCINHRIAKQVKYLEENLECMVVGSWVDFIETNNNHIFTLKHPESFQLISRRMRINAALTHPSIMFRASLVNM